MHPVPPSRLHRGLASPAPTASHPWVSWPGLRPFLPKDARSPLSWSLRSGLCRQLDLRPLLRLTRPGPQSLGSGFLSPRGTETARPFASPPGQLPGFCLRPSSWQWSGPSLRSPPRASELSWPVTSVQMPLYHISRFLCVCNARTVSHLQKSHEDFEKNEKSLFGAR